LFFSCSARRRGSMLRAATLRTAQHSWLGSVQRATRGSFGKKLANKLHLRLGWSSESDPRDSSTSLLILVAFSRTTWHISTRTPLQMELLTQNMLGNHCYHYYRNFACQRLSLLPRHACSQLAFGSCKPRCLRLSHLVQWIPTLALNIH